MPWNKKTIVSHNKSLSGGGAAKAASIANAVLRDSGDEGKALRVANYQVTRMRKAGKISDKAMAKHASGLDSTRDVDAATA